MRKRSQYLERNKSWADLMRPHLGKVIDSAAFSSRMYEYCSKEFSLSDKFQFVVFDVPRGIIKKCKEGIFEDVKETSLENGVYVSTGIFHNIELLSVAALDIHLRAIFGARYTRSLREGHDMQLATIMVDVIDSLKDYSSDVEAKKYIKKTGLEV